MSLQELCLETVTKTQTQTTILVRESIETTYEQHGVTDATLLHIWTDESVEFEIGILEKFFLKKMLKRMILIILINKSLQY